LPYEVEQSTNCCSEKDTSEPELIKFNPSREPVVEKAQHDPHEPWFLIGVTAPLESQLTVSFSSPTVRSLTFLALFEDLYPRRALYSLALKSLRPVTPRV